MVIIVDDSFNYPARFIMKYHAASSAVIVYLQTPCSSDMFQFDMIVDDSFLLFDQADDIQWSFFGQQFCQKWAQTEMEKCKMT